jgi:hypothetical protein
LSDTESIKDDVLKAKMSSRIILNFVGELVNEALADTIVNLKNASKPTSPPFPKPHPDCAPIFPGQNPFKGRVQKQVSIMQSKTEVPSQ